MACGCAGQCGDCGVKGLGFLLTGESGGGDEFDWADPSTWWFDDYGYNSGDDFNYGYGGEIDADPFRVDTYSPFASSNSGGNALSDAVQSLLDWWDEITGGVPSSDPNLPGYCPGGYYHPIEDPFSCVPFPPNPTPAQRARKQQQDAAKRAATQRPKPSQPTCPPGYVKDQRTGQCVKNCPPGYARHPQTGQCVQVNLLPAGTDLSKLPWWVWALLIAGGYKIIAGGNYERTVTYRTRRRK